MKRTLIALGIALSVFVSGANAAEPDIWTTRSWMQVCAKSEGICAGYVIGVLQTHETLSAYGLRRLWCAPDGLSNWEAKNIILTYAAKNPEHQGKRFSTMAVAAMITAFPCKGK